MGKYNPIKLDVFPCVPYYSVSRSPSQGDSIVLFTFLFLSLFGQIDSLQDRAGFFVFFILKGDLRGIIKRKEFYPFLCGFRQMIF